MKIDRLIGIIAILQQNKKVTAPFLAEKFEVSRRTINRDVEAICKAGIPVVTEQGVHGGISLMEGFSLDTTVFTTQELSEIFTGLKTLDSVSSHQRAPALAEKIGDTALTQSNYLNINLASFYKDDLASKIEQIKAALFDKHCLRFHYFSNKGESDKLVEPYQIVYQWSDWYLLAYSLEQQDFRLYKLRRLWNLSIVEDSFQPRTIPNETTQFNSRFTDDYMISAIYQPAVKFRLIEEYGPQSFTTEQDGTLCATYGFTTQESALYWFLSFGDQVKVTEPAEFSERLQELLARALRQYT